MTTTPDIKTQLRETLAELAAAKAERDEARTTSRTLNRRVGALESELSTQGSKGAWKRYFDCACGLWSKAEKRSESANARVKELEESFAFLQQQGTTDEDGDFVLHLVLSKHHSGLESAITARAKGEALAKGAA